MHFLSSPLSVCLQFILVLFYYHRELRKKKGFHLTLLILPHTHPPIENCVCMRLHKNLETSRPVVPNLESAESVLGGQWTKFKISYTHKDKYIKKSPWENPFKWLAITVLDIGNKSLTELQLDKSEWHENSGSRKKPLDGISRRLVQLKTNYFLWISVYVFIFDI